MFFGVYTIQAADAIGAPTRIAAPNPDQSRSSRDLKPHSPTSRVKRKDSPGNDRAYRTKV